ATLTGHSYSVSAVACTEVDGQPVAVTTSHDNTARVWDLASGSLRATLTGHTSSVLAVACTEVDGQPVAVTTSHDETARVWDLATGTRLAVLDYTGYTTGALCIGPAQEIILGSGWDLLVIDRGGPGR
ncbi:MAG: WD40 repeat domain-containing protein, partial [Pseudonocardiaceae bacterium]